MKRIFSILLLFGLMLCLAVPTLAEDTITATWHADDIDFANAPLGNYSFSITISGKTYTSIEFKKETRGGELQIYIYGISSNGTRLSIGNWDAQGVYESGADLSVVSFANFSHEELQVINYYFTPNLCDGSSCPATDLNEDNICDDCGKPLTYSLRNDTYSFNGYSFPRTMELEDGSTVDIFDYWEQLGGLYNFVILSRTGNFESALFYLVAPNVEFINGNAVTAVEDTNIILFKPSFTDDGTPYWKYEATDIWGTKGALLAPKDQVLWSAKTILSGDSNPDIIKGDPNFMIPLWEMVEKVTQGEMPKMTESLVGSVTLLTACGIGLLALLVVLVLLRRKSLIFLR